MKPKYKRVFTLIQDTYPSEKVSIYRSHIFRKKYKRYFSSCKYIIEVPGKVRVIIRKKAAVVFGNNEKLQHKIKAIYDS